MSRASRIPNGAISLSGVSKRFKLYRSSRHRLTDILSRRATHRDLWALRDIDIDIAPGEAVGLIGANGSGKSTLLHLIAGTRTTTSGRLGVGGKVASLLELGVGFHPEWTARQNVHFYLRLCEIAEVSIEALEQEIEAFADIGDYFDQPQRACSTGMAMRVAFAAAALIPSDILIIDEALAVGDSVFQHKCFQLFEKRRADGVTILFVTHQMSLIPQICSRALLLQKGRLLFDGAPRQAVDHYHALIGEAAPVESEQGRDRRAPTAEMRYGSGEATIGAIDISPPANGKGFYEAGERVAIRVAAEFAAIVEAPQLGFSIKSREGTIIFSTTSDQMGQPIKISKPGEEVVFDIAFPLNMPTGTIFLDFSLFSAGSAGLRVLDGRLSAASLDIQAPDRFFGLVDVGVSMRIAAGPVTPRAVIQSTATPA